MYGDSDCGADNERAASERDGKSVKRPSDQRKCGEGSSVRQIKGRERIRDAITAIRAAIHLAGRVRA